MRFINRKKNEYDAERAIFLAAVCGQTYDQFEHADGGFTVPDGYEMVYIIHAKSFGGIQELFGFVLESPQDIILAFRGTSTATNWISDVIASQTRFKPIKSPCLVHRGFYEIYTSARAGILSALAGLSADKPLYIAGHSLGGALATLCATDVGANTSFGVRLYTYGSPRAGDPAFAKACGGNVRDSWRFANRLDVVAYAPPTVYKLPRTGKTYYYSHVQTFVPLFFQNGSVSLNHVIGSYFTELVKLKPDYAKALCAANPGFCPPLMVPLSREEPVV